MASKSWANFLEDIERAKAQLDFKKNEECFFRGHTHTDHRLVPGLLRYLDFKVPIEEVWYNESDMFYEFRARAKEVHHGNLTDWDILFYMQHHGVKTRLLDWSESFGVALFFAMYNYTPESSPCIWVMNPYKLNELSTEHRDLYAPENLDQYNYKEEEWESYADFLLYDQPSKIWWKQPIALYPIRRVDRLTTQGGYFTIQGKDARPIDQIISVRKNIWRKLPIPKEAINGAQLFLEQAGINQFTMFPDLDGLARYLNKKYFTL